MRFSGIVKRWKRKRAEKRSRHADLSENRKSFVLRWITFAWLYDPLRALAAVDIRMSDRMNSHSGGNWFGSVWIRLCSSLPPEALSHYITETVIEIEMDIFCAGWWDKVGWYSLSGSLRCLMFDASFIGWSEFPGLTHFMVWVSFKLLYRLFQVNWFNTV